eukprot:gene28951-35912_t
MSNEVQTEDITRQISPILKDKHGAPSNLPLNTVGSISHKHDLAVAVARVVNHKVNQPDKGEIFRAGHIGVDIEHTSNKAHERLSERLLTDNERSTLGREEMMLRFSFKESAYKALSPFLQRYVDFSEVEIYPQNDGTAVLNFCLQTRELFEYKAEYHRMTAGDGRQLKYGGM